jgi:hypothetical protein
MSAKKGREVDSDAKAIATGITELVQLRKQAMKATSTSKSTGLKYESMLANLDRMLCKLPEPVVEDLNMQFVSLAYAEVKKYDKLVEVTLMNNSE